MPNPLSSEELVRYGRHLILPEVGVDGQAKLKEAKVLCVGAGGLGSPLMTYLAAAGIGTLGLVDDDTVDLSNLHRQPIHFTQDLGRTKLESAAEKLYAINSNVGVQLHPERLTRENALRIIEGYDILADGTDNFAARYLVSDACVKLGKPNVHAAIYRFQGQVSVFDAERGPCYRCLFPEPPPPGTAPSCAEAGVLGVLPGVAGTLQAAEVLKLILGIGDPLIGRLLTFDLLDSRFKEVRLPKDQNCPVCSKPCDEIELMEYPDHCGNRTMATQTPEISVEDLHAAVAGGAVLVDVREAFEIAQGALPYKHHIPLGALQGRMRELSPDDDLIIYCRSGARSASATQFLLSHGYPRVRNLIGGMLAIDAAGMAIDRS